MPCVYLPGPAPAVTVANTSHPSRKKTAFVFKNPENAGMIRKISFQAKSYLFNLHEMFKNSGSEEECMWGKY